MSPIRVADAFIAQENGCARGCNCKCGYTECESPRVPSITVWAGDATSFRKYNQSVIARGERDIDPCRAAGQCRATLEMHHIGLLWFKDNLLLNTGHIPRCARELERGFSIQRNNRSILAAQAPSARLVAF